MANVSQIRERNLIETNFDSSLLTQNFLSAKTLPNSISNNSQISNQKLEDFFKNSFYPIVQENGQRKYGPPPDWGSLDEPDRGCEIFIGKIPRDCFENELIPLLEKIGKIYEFRLMMEYSGYNRGYGFAMFTNKHDAKRAVIELNNYELRKGRTLGVCRSVDNCRLFVGGIPKNKKKEEIFEEMRKATNDVLDVIVYPSAHDKTKNRGFAFVQYSNHRAAAIARRKLLPNKTQLFGQPIVVDWAEPEPVVDEEVMSTVRVLYVRNLMISTTEEKIKQEFEKLKPDSVERVKKLKDFAFVHFKERDDALNAMRAMNGSKIDDSIIEINLSKPVEKSSILKLTKTVTVPNNELLLKNYYSPTNNEINIINGAQTINQIFSIQNSSINNSDQPFLIPQATHQIFTPIFNSKLTNESNQSLYSTTYGNEWASNNTASINNSINLNHFNKAGKISKAVGSRHVGSSYKNSYLNLIKGGKRKTASTGSTEIDSYSEIKSVPILEITNPLNYFQKCPVEILEEYCLNKGMSLPNYTLHTAVGHDIDGKETGLFMYRVSIPGMFNNNQFCSNNLLKTIDEAKYEAASFILSHIYQNDATNADETYTFLENSFFTRPIIYRNGVNTEQIITSYSSLVENSLLNPSISAIPQQVRMTTPQTINGEIPTVISAMPTQYFVDSNGYTYISS